MEWISIICSGVVEIFFSGKDGSAPIENLTRTSMTDNIKYMYLA